MNQTVAAVLIIWAVAAALWTFGRAVVGARAASSSLPATMLSVAVIAWLATGVVAWVTGSAPTRPGVFAGYAVVAAGVVPVGLTLAGRATGRRADLLRAVTFALLAFLCYRSEVVFL